MNLLLGKMSLVSQGTTSSLGAIKGGDDNSAPPGAWSKYQDNLASEWRGLFERLVIAGELQLERAQKSPSGLANKESRDDRLLDVWPNRFGYDSKLIAYVEDCSEDYILKLWRRQGVG